MRANRRAVSAFALAAAAFCLLSADVRPAQAQAQPGRVFLGFSGGIQSGVGELASSIPFRRPLFGLENGLVEASYPYGGSTAIDVGGGIRIGGILGFGVNMSLARDEADTEIEASVPHPFVFNRPRMLTATQSGLSRQETALHVQALAVIPAGRSLVITLFGGPTLFNISQHLVTEVDVLQAYPFDTVEYNGPTVTEFTASAIGAHAGADVAWYFSRNIGVGALVRFSRGSVEFPLSNDDVLVDPMNPEFVQSDVGGLQTMGGLRIRF